MSNEDGLFSVLTLTFNRPELLRELKECLFRQTYSNFEWVVINNAATPETVELLEKWKREDSRIKTVDYEKNQYLVGGSSKMVEICYNDALKAASGEFVFFISDDDLMSEDYLERMVRLFRENARCTTAAGLPAVIDAAGRVIDQGERASNFRSRYMPGRVLASDICRGGTGLFSSAGNAFAMRRKTLLDAGGYSPVPEVYETLAILPFGVTGFDEKALLYWRYHDDQLNRRESAEGKLAVKHVQNILKKGDVVRRWRDAFGEAAASEVYAYLRHRIVYVSSNWFLINLFSWRIGAALKILRDVIFDPGFWAYLPVTLWKQKRRLLSIQTKGFLRFAFEALPDEFGASKDLRSLKEKAYRND